MTTNPTTSSPPGRDSSRVRLVDIGFVRAVHECDTETVLNSIGDWQHPKFVRWVFDLAVRPGGTRHLRFWKDEIVSTVDKWAEPSAIIEQIIGARASEAPGQLEVEWLLSAQTMMRLRQAGEIVQENGRFTRASLATFLQRRLQ